MRVFKILSQIIINKHLIAKHNFSIYKYLTLFIHHSRFFVALELLV